MNAPPPTSCTAFAGTKRIASGELRHVAVKAKTVMDRDRWAQVLIFDDLTSNVIEVDFRGTPQDVAHRVAETAATAAESNQPAQAPGDARRPGRPKLGVVAREVTLLPRHWDWLASQPGGASVALRKLVEQARTANQGKDRRRRAQEAAYRFMTAMAGKEAGDSDARMAPCAGDRDHLAKTGQRWPMDVRDHPTRPA